MEFVVRKKNPNETIWKIKYYDCDLNTTGNLSKLSFDSAEVAKAYGKIHYAYENTGYTNYEGVVEIKEDTQWRYCHDLNSHCEAENDCRNCPYGIDHYE